LSPFIGKEIYQMAAPVNKKGAEKIARRSLWAGIDAGEIRAG
jgi:hypothetical protein